jgi:hypothetical protein
MVCCYNSPCRKIVYLGKNVKNSPSVKNSTIRHFLFQQSQRAFKSGQTGKRIAEFGHPDL